MSEMIGVSDMFGNGSRRRTWLAVATGTAMTLAVTMVGTQAAMAQEPQWNWGTSRQLATCPDKTNPKTGKMTVALATMHVVCFYEERPPYNANVTFADIASLRIVAQRKARTRDIMLWPDIDQKRPVYDLRGSMFVHTCTNITTTEYSPKQGANCSLSVLPKAKGTCWVDIEGDWSCYLGGIDPYPKRKQPAPQ
jgi:hypothetical protein